MSSSGPWYGRIQPGLQLFAGGGRRHGPEPLALMCGKMLWLFGKGRSHLGHAQHSGSPQPRSATGVDAAAVAARSGGYLGTGRDGAHGMDAGQVLVGSGEPAGT